MKKLIVIFASAQFSLCGFAATRYWTGAANDGMWHNKDNWSGTTVPVSGDTGVFTNDTPISISLGKYTSPEGSAVSGSPALRGYDFRGKDVCLYGNTLSVQGQIDKTDPYVKVAEGTTVTISNSVQQYNKGDITKRGKGTLRQVCTSNSASSGHRYACQNGRKLVIEEGVWDMVLADGLRYGCYCTVSYVQIDKGAAFYLCGYNATSQTATWRVDGELYLRTYPGKDTIGTISGCGKVLPAPGATFDSATELKVGTAFQPGGDGAIGELSIGYPLDLSSTPRLCIEDDGTSMDKLTYTYGTLDLSAFAGMTYKVIGTNRSVQKQVVLSAKTMTNEFAEFQTDGPGAECAIVKYVKNEVIVNPRNQGLILFFK